MTIDLIALSLHDKPVITSWPLGRICIVKPSIQALNDLIAQYLPSAQADFWLFWDVHLGAPDPEFIQKLTTKPADIWHAGLQLGTGGLPGIADFVSPAWMLNCDPPSTIEASSWRVSLRACLVRATALQNHGFIRPEFLTLEGAALEWGYRCIKNGVLVRHSPAILPQDIPAPNIRLPLEDELRFVRCCFDRRLSSWAILRCMLTGYVPATLAVKSLLKRGNATTFRKSESIDPELPQAHELNTAGGEEPEQNPQVSVLIPTIDRYPYLHQLLTQLREQTIPPLEIIVVDQTPMDRRDESLYKNFSDLPIHVIFQSEAGQCSSRNLGLRSAKGDFVVFLDDDVEISPDLIACHIANLKHYHADVSSGVIDEIGATVASESSSLIRISDVFPAGNTMIRRSILSHSGLFDLAYDHGSRADGDLGMRIYLNGGLMILNQAIRVLHHRAPRGGLRTHKARTVTRSSSRQSLWQRHLPSVTEVYLAKRFFSSRQLREMLFLRLLSTFSLHTNGLNRILKILIGIVLLPHTLWRLHKVQVQATEMLERYPQIPTYFHSS